MVWPCGGQRSMRAIQYCCSTSEAIVFLMPIDVHAHYVPPQLIDAIDARGKDIGVRLARSDGAPPALQFDYGLAPDACVAWHRMLNDTLVEWCADNADRFAWIASVPLTQAEAAAQEL